LPQTFVHFPGWRFSTGVVRSALDRCFVGLSDSSDARSRAEALLCFNKKKVKNTENVFLRGPMKKGSVKTSATFLGFGGSPDGADIPEATLSGETQKDLARLSKKDSTTKIKALSKLCDDAKQDDPTLFVVAWSKAYVLISQDLDWRVRQEVYTTWQTIGMFVDKVKQRKNVCCFVFGSFDGQKKGFAWKIV
jgi:hypothetical protein